MLHTYNVVSYGVGVNSTAMIVGMYQQEIPIDLILFADTGSEMPHTYQYIPVMNKWLKIHDLPLIRVVEKYDRDGNRFMLEQECFKSKTMPSLAYGWRKCSIKHKKAVQDKFCNNHPFCHGLFAQDLKVNRFIGYDAAETRRVINARKYDVQDKKYEYVYPLFDWGWDRQRCIEEIRAADLEVPKKSSCYFCPGMKKHEIEQLWVEYPALFAKAVAIETEGLKTARTVKGLGRSYSWEQYYLDKQQEQELSAA